MYSREHKDQLPESRSACDRASSGRKCPGISTERIMQAVEEQRRVSQQLEDLRTQQKQRTDYLRIVALKLLGILWGLFGIAAAGFIILLIVRPALLDRTLNSLDDSIAFLLALSEQTKQELSLIPSSNWILSAAALAVVLMMGLWIRLMRHPQDA